MAAVAVVGALTSFAACSGDDDDASVVTGGELIRLDTTTIATTTVPATTVPATAAGSTTVAEQPVDPVESCLDWYQFKISSEDPDVVEFYEDELDEDLAQLLAECQRLAAEDPARVEEMAAENKAIDEFLRQMAAQSSTTTTTSSTTTTDPTD